MPCILNFADSTTAVVVISMMGRFFVTFSVNTVMQQVSDSCGDPRKAFSIGFVNRDESFTQPNTRVFVGHLYNPQSDV